MAVKGSWNRAAGARVVFAAAAGCGFAAPAYADWDQTAKLTADDPAAGDVFGFSVGISGTIAIVGAPQDDDAGSSAGSAYVFDTTTGAQIAKLTAPDAAANDRFGESVGVSGTIAIVGAHEDDDAGSNSGSAYLFDTTTGSQLFKLTANDAAAGDEFGFSVGISGATAIVGAHADGAGFNSGSAYLFDTITGAQIAKLTANDAAVNDWFGESVGISGTTAIVGARFDDDAGFSSGSAYLFDTTTGAQIAKLTASDAAAGDWFGYSVGISGTTAIVGAHADDDAGSASGSAYLFDTTTGAQIAKLTANDAAARDNFGFSVGISGTIAIVGAHADDDAGYSSGSVYLFDTTTGNQIAKLTASDAAAHDRFGWSVGISGTTAVVGAYADDDGGGNSGSAYVYKFVLPGDADGNGSVDLFDFHILAANFGASTGNLGEDGDFNGDGVVDLIDFDTLAQNFGSTSPAVVPAPASLSLLGLASPLLLRGRARRRRS